MSGEEEGPQGRRGTEQDGDGQRKTKVDESEQDGGALLDQHPLTGATPGQGRCSAKGQVWLGCLSAPEGLPPEGTCYNVWDIMSLL